MNEKNFDFAAAVAQFGMLLKNSSFLGKSTFDDVLEAAAAANSHDAHGHRTEFLELVRVARDLTTEQKIVSSPGRGHTPL